jgi:uncharacterized protein with PIN domain
MMLIFHRNLGELLPASLPVFRPDNGDTTVVLRNLTGPTSVKDLIEALGIPHCEIGAIVSLVSGRKLSLQARTVAGDVLEVRPVLEFPLSEPRFLCDGHLGKLALLLRVLGFDAEYDKSWSEPGMARRGLNEDRTILTCSRSLLKRAELDNAMLLRSDAPDEQAVEVLRRFVLAGRVRLFGRCSRCNGTLREVAKDAVAERIPPRTAKWLDTYYLCRDCDQLFWEGTHVLALRERVTRIIARCGPDMRQDGS